MGVAQKFLFDLSFDAPFVEAPAAPAPEPEPEAPPAPPPPAISEAELAAARAAAFDEGRRAGLAEAEASRETALAASLATIAERLGALATSADAARAEAERAAVGLALTVARKFVPAHARQHALEELVALVADCLRQAADEPRIVVRVPDALFEAARDRLAALPGSTGFAGKIVVLAEETLGPADCRVEWADGGAERDAARLWREIDAAVERALAANPASETNPTGMMPGDDR